MTEGDGDQNIHCGSPSTGFLAAGLPIQSKTYRRPSPLRQRLTSPTVPMATSLMSAPSDVKPCSKSNMNIPDTVSPVGNIEFSASETAHFPGSSKPTYERLRPGQIRLLRLYPSENHEDQIRVVLKSVALDTFEKYTAISYAWGDRRSMTTITIDGEIRNVTTSLRHALTSVRREDEPIWIWVDALSINQHDVDELNSQVQRMDLIYSMAETVAVCLGPHSEADDSRLAFAHLWNASYPDRYITHLVTSERQISAIVRLFERDYWKRL